MKRIFWPVVLAVLALSSPGQAQVIGGGVGGLTVGAAINGFCINGYVLYNNNGLLGCQAASAASLSIGGSITGSTAGYGLYVGTGGSANLLEQFAYGANVFAALGNALNGASGLVGYSGQLGTPTQGVLTNATGLPAATGIASGALPSDVTVNNANWSGTALSNANLANPATTVAGQTCTLGSTCSIAYSNLSSGAPTATSSVLGLVKPDGTSISNSSGAISLNTANANSWSALQTFAAGDISLTGATTGCAQFTGTILSSTGTACSSGGGGVSIGGTIGSAAVAGGILFDSGPGMLEESSGFTWNGTTNTITDTILTNTYATGLQLTNPTAATSYSVWGNSPSLQFSNNVWNGSSSIEQDWRIQGIGNIGSGNWGLNFDLQTAGGGYVNVLNAYSGTSGINGLYINGNLNVSNNFIANPGSGYFQIVSGDYLMMGSAILTGPSSAVLQLGNFDAAAPVAQTLGVQNVVAGTSNTAGSNWTLQGSLGTGSGHGGNVSVAVAPAGTSGTAHNSTINALTIEYTGHLLTASAAAPALTGCGSGSPSIASGSTDVAGEVTEGTTATGCVVTFKVTYTNTPFCTVTPKSGLLAAFSYAVSTTAITVTNTSNSGEVFDYHCVGH